MADLQVKRAISITLTLNEREIQTLRAIMQNPNPAYDNSNEVQELSEELFNKLSDVINEYLK
jgi:hypothetical protein